MDNGPSSLQFSLVHLGQCERSLTLCPSCSVHLSQVVWSLSKSMNGSSCLRHRRYTVSLSWRLQCVKREFRYHQK